MHFKSFTHFSILLLYKNWVRNYRCWFVWLWPKFVIFGSFLINLWKLVCGCSGTRKPAWLRLWCVSVGFLQFNQPAQLDLWLLLILANGLHNSLWPIGICMSFYRGCIRVPMFVPGQTLKYQAITSFCWDFIVQWTDLGFSMISRVLIWDQDLIQEQTD